MFENIQQVADELQPRMVAFLQKLIQTPSLSGEEEGVSELCMAEMKSLGYDEVFRDEWGNVTGIIKGDGPGPNIMFNSHMDHMPTGDAEKWEGFDPYGAVITRYKTAKQDPAEEEDAEVIMGRGGAEMKGSIATHIYTGAIVLELRKRFGYRTKGDFVISNVVLEEPGDMAGTIKLLNETFPAKNITVQACVLGEPTSLRLALGHRGRMELCFNVHGRTAHGSAPWRGVNAVNKAIKLITEFEKTVDAEKRRDPDMGDSGYALTIINCLPGTKGAVIPDECNVVYDRRFPTGESPQDCVDQVQRIIDRLASEDKDFRADVAVNENVHHTYTGKTITILNQKDAFKLDRQHPMAKACGKALERIGHESKYFYWDFGTDAPATHVMHNIPTIGYSGLQEVYCHTPLERVRMDFLAKSLAGNAAIYLELSEMDVTAFTL